MSEKKTREEEVDLCTSTSHHEFSLHWASSVDSMKVLYVASSSTRSLFRTRKGCLRESTRGHSFILSVQYARVYLEDEAGGVTERGTLVCSSN